MANYSFDKVKDCKFENGKKFNSDNFTQAKPHTKIGGGYKGLVFENCNLCNCDVPEGSTVKDCLTVQISRCSHLHEGLPFTCETECEHMVSKDEIVVDGKTEETIYEYEDKVVK